TLGTTPTWTTPTPTHHTNLPTYPFQHQHYWLKDTGKTGAADVTTAGLHAADHPLLGAVAELPGSGGTLFTGRLSLRTHPWLGGHRVMGTVLLPGTAFVDLAIRAGDHVGCGRLDELTLQAPLVLPDDGAVQVQLLVGAPDDSGHRTLSVHSRPAAEGASTTAQAAWTQHASAVLAPEAPVASDSPWDVWPPRDAEAVGIDGFYATSLQQGFDYGPCFQGLRAVWRRGEEVFAEVVLPEEELDAAATFGLHPALLDSALHSVALTGVTGDAAVLPFAWNGVQLHATGASALRLRMVPTENGGGVSVHITDHGDRPVATIESLVLRPVSAEQIPAGRAPQDQWLYRVSWEAVASGTDAAPEAVWLGAGERPAGTEGLEDHADLAALREAFASGRAMPGLVYVPFFAEAEPNGQAVPALTAARTAAALALLQEWTSEPAFETSQLVLVTRGAMATAPGEPVPDPAGAAVWGLARSAQTEFPGRVALLDLSGTDLPLDAAGSAFAAGEHQLALRDGAVLVPRLTPAQAAPEAAGTAWSSEGTVLIT
ncbi:polyketide synthase dehydratase domain-containing protein, partial [Streptomyces sp. NPDC048331]|uniref:polyketide synthase dehydratase domain-containing protein n=1 Tax=Streptomyces sp. NPDC048331 TaxID=3365534 RepID=UPI00370FBE6F